VKEHFISDLIDETGDLDPLKGIEIVIVMKTTIDISTRDVIGTVRDGHCNL
jgi:hypothetical protein